jgi:hypothetical protein
MQTEAPLPDLGPASVTYRRERTEISLPVAATYSLKLLNWTWGTTT